MWRGRRIVLDKVFGWFGAGGSVFKAAVTDPDSFPPRRVARRPAPIRWTPVACLALGITAFPLTLLWHHHQVDRDFGELYRLLAHARATAFTDAPVTVRFTSHRAVVEDRDGGTLGSLWLPTLDEVRYRTIQGEAMIVFTPETSPYNVHLHGGDIRFRSWTGYDRSIRVHCTGGITEGRNDDWALNPVTAIATP